MFRLLITCCIQVCGLSSHRGLPTQLFYTDVGGKAFLTFYSCEKSYAGKPGYEVTRGPYIAIIGTKNEELS